MRAPSGSAEVQALVLDFGGVISKTLFETHDLSEAALGLPRGALTWRGPFDPATDPLWLQMQRDEISERDYWMIRSREVAALVDEDWSDIETFVKRARGADPAAIIRPEAVAAITALRRGGYRLAILSNELDLFYGADFRQRLPLLDSFETIVDATYTAILKPDPRAYQAVTAALNLPASACVFLDDQWRNVQGAEAAGMHALHFDVTAPARTYDAALARFGLPPV